ncbi:MAG: preprotein translocase subunit SecE [Chitinophagales bacterium]|nr:preprotein translocase subunit SecE [Chitinophagales bacterium]MCZ2392710.1 preprotein translocase subunit SecE [Chitinophagales bacterium]
MNNIINYFKDSYDELVNRVTWPTFKDLQKDSLIVAVASIIIALIIGLMDMSGSLLFTDFIYKLAN